jgi:hypothetical protein
MFNKRYQVQRTFFTVKHFPNRVDAAMPNNKLSERLRIYLVLMIPDNKAKEPLDRVTCMRKKYPWNE